MGEHAFSACEVCADGRWRQGKWVGRANKQECQMRFGKWASHLHASVVVSGEEGGEKSLETHRVQASWWQNAFIFATRPHQPASPKGLLAASEPEREAARKEAAQRAEAVARILEEAKAAKAARRNASRNHGARRSTGRLVGVAERPPCTAGCARGCGGGRSRCGGGGGGDYAARPKKVCLKLLVAVSA